LALGLAAALLAGLAAPLAAGRAPYAMWLPGLAVLGGVTLLLTLGLRKLVPALFRLAGLELEPEALRALLLLFVAGFWIKGGGQLYPYMIAIDIHWHMDRVRWILDGRLAEMYRPGAFNESVMPEREFGANRPVIPYSPFFHIFATSFAIFPWKLETTAKIFSAAIDNSRVFIIFFLGRQFGLSRRAGLLASALYAVLPATYLLHSWGNVPTTFGMWWTLIACCFIIAAWGRLREPKVFAWLTAVLLATFLMYTVMAVFLGMTLIVWMAFVGFRHRDQNPQVRAVAAGTALALAASLAIYYAQYIPGIVERTLPYFGTTLTQGQEAVGAIQYQATAADNAWAYIQRLWNYGLLPVFLIAPLALWLFARDDTSRPGAPESAFALDAKRRWLGRTWICAMIVVALLFIPIDRSVPMVDKHIFYLLAPLALLMGHLMDRSFADWRLLGAMGAAVLGAMMIRGIHPIFYLVPLAALAGGWALSRAAKRWEMPALPLALTYAALLAAALELWVRRIETVKQVW
ncbi:MAG TPA: hypothetical protein VGE07_21050, partial [Herpetosiphonaceae bacterium]